MVDPNFVGGVVAVATIAVAVAYSYLSGEDVEGSADVDGDGEDDVSHTFEGSDAEFEMAPEDVQVVGTSLAEITGIGDTRSDDLKRAGFHNASDIYFASDEELTSISGIGDLTVSQIRGDIGSAEAEDGDE